MIVEIKSLRRIKLKQVICVAVDFDQHHHHVDYNDDD